MTGFGFARPMPESSSWVGAVVVECQDLPRMIAFWTRALRYVPRDPPEADGVVLKDPSGHGPNLSLQRTSDPPIEGYRLHLDLYSATPTEEVERLVQLGATVQRRPSRGEDFVTLADPDGNLFDVIDKPGWSFGQRS
jgi:catechol 2,3-dioxygenase-like lactoylglutathione lyase family enzyme